MAVSKFRHVLTCGTVNLSCVRRRRRSRRFRIDS